MSVAEDFERETTITSNAAFIIRNWKRCGHVSDLDLAVVKRWVRLLGIFWLLLLLNLARLMSKIALASQNKIYILACVILVLLLVFYQLGSTRSITSYDQDVGSTSRDLSDSKRDTWKEQVQMKWDEPPLVAITVWLGDKKPDYLPWFFESVKRNQNMTLLFVITTASPYCLNGTAGERYDENIRFLCFTPEQLYRRIAGGMCSVWNCTSDESDTTFEAIQTYLNDVYAIHELSNTWASVFHKEIFNWKGRLTPFSHWIRVNTDIFFGDLDFTFPWHLLPRYDVIALRPSNGWKYLWFAGTSTIFRIIPYMDDNWIYIAEMQTPKNFAQYFITRHQRERVNKAGYAYGSSDEGAVATEIFRSRHITFIMWTQQMLQEIRRGWHVDIRGGDLKSVLYLPNDVSDLDALELHKRRDAPRNYTVVLKNHGPQRLTRRCEGDGMWWTAPSTRTCISTEEEDKLPSILTTEVVSRDEPLGPILRRTVENPTYETAIINGERVGYLRMSILHFFFWKHNRAFRMRETTLAANEMITDRVIPWKISTFELDDGKNTSVNAPTLDSEVINATQSSQKPPVIYHERGRGLRSSALVEDAPTLNQRTHSERNIGDDSHKRPRQIDETTFGGWFQHKVRKAKKYARKRVTSFFTWKNWLAWFKSRQFIYTFKSTLTVSLLLVLHFVPVFANYLGALALLNIATAILFDMTAGPGAAIETGFFFAFITAASCAISGFALWTSFEQPWGLAFWLVLLLLIISYIRAKVPLKYMGSTILSTLLIIIIILFGYRTPAFSVNFPFQVWLNGIIGQGLSVIICACIFPTRIAKITWSEAREALNTINEALEMGLDTFKNGGDEERLNEMSKLNDKCKGHIIKFRTLTVMLRSEGMISKRTPQDTISVVQDIQQILFMTRRILTSSPLTSTLRNQPTVTETVDQLFHPIRSMMDVTKEGLNILREGRMSEKEIEKLKESVKMFDDRVVEILAQKLDKAFTHEDIVGLSFFVKGFRELVHCTIDFSEKVIRTRLKRRRLFIPLIWRDWSHDFCGIFKRGDEIDTPQRQKKTWGIRIAEHSRHFFLFLLSPFYDDAFKFAVKISLSVFICTLLQWIDNTKYWYIDHRGEWAAITVGIIFTPNFGASFLNGAWRIAGTIIGATWALLTYVIFGGETVWGISVMTILICVPSFHIKTSGGPHSKIAVIGLVTFAAITLVKYYYRNNPAYFTIYKLYWVRLVAISIGIVLALIVDRLFWPVLARDRAIKTLARSLSLASHAYGKCLSQLISSDETVEKELIAIEGSITACITACTQLLGSAESEPTLHKPLDIGTYRKILATTSDILQNLITLRICAFRDPLGDTLRREIVEPLMGLRRNHVSLTLMRFWVASEAIHHKQPISQALPSNMKARSQMFEKLRELPFITNGIEPRHTMQFLSYCTTQIYHDIEDILSDIVKLNGEQQSVQGLFLEE
ncbi:hypothetical protein PROFUN_03059 [Planoprotostelium fungivorum]|uniref:Integral membrane bound transporter domain-containing protein n=1 Tax=Planoprotostelium fungivorum TaxID=1890364 RepID=A0A2P6NQ42_9EUKA|nr:hypothetical protein PROFUN_03059 [Planoprotostelium fungivorum]